MGDGVAAFPFGIAFKEFADLEEQHDEDGFGEFRLGTGQKTDGESSERGNRHQEVLVEGVALGNAFCRLLQSLVTR